MWVYVLVLLAILSGAGLIGGALYLIYAKRISLDHVAKNPSLEGEAIKIEIENLIKVSSNVPALGLFLVGLTLIVAGLYFANEEGKRKTDDLRQQLAAAEKARDEYARNRLKLYVTGTVAKSDQSSPHDIEVQMGWPPFHPDDMGKLSGLAVQRNSDGRFPVLAFLHPNYGPATLDLNTDANIQGDDIVIPAGRVVLKKLPGQGGTQ